MCSADGEDDDDDDDDDNDDDHDVLTVLISIAYFPDTPVAPVD